MGEEILGRLIMTCDKYVNCPASPSSPLLGYSAETPDVLKFNAMGFGPRTSPPLNWDIGQAVGFAIAHSTVSEYFAEQAAVTNATANAQSTWVPPGGQSPVEIGDEEIWDILNGLDVGYV